MAVKNGFDALLEKLGDANDTSALQSLASKYPVLKESILMQSDYSRKMDEVRDKLKEAEVNAQALKGWESWRDENYDDQAKATKAEIALRAQAQELQEKLNAIEGNEMTAEQMQAHLDSLLAGKGFMPKADVEKVLADKTKEFEDRLFAVTSLTSALVPLSTKHFQEFGEPLDVEEMFKIGNEKKLSDPKSAYDAMVAGRRAERTQAQHEEALKLAREEGRKEAVQNLNLGENGRFPSDSGDPVMSITQRRHMGLSVEEDEEVGKGVELGPNLGMHVAAKYKRDKQLQGA
jgi:hypothetical protein